MRPCVQRPRVQRRLTRPQPAVRGPPQQRQETATVNASEAKCVAVTIAAPCAASLATLAIEEQHVEWSSEQPQIACGAPECRSCARRWPRAVRARGASMVRRHCSELPSQHRIPSEAGRCAGTAPAQRRTRSYAALRRQLARCGGASAAGKALPATQGRSSEGRERRLVRPRGACAVPLCCVAADHVRSGGRPPRGDRPNTAGRGPTAHAPLHPAAA